ncbi:hypothetical protein Mp_4g13320 [Marchantia polymorpha subsp. ruderalis]|uniref:Uncharacterized protein n=2 Tax=Marchantia polymorpha TaxID=3197 RepID=A0AAF6B9H0_MARPO|nr:hypothetical protein MARPO_2879s0001 [Marchantia polymorpha]BBN08654.1 hypothetical protein Mp_4g13320 [Marchantia polymorpha subsp. ruderalis]|eukprot:PTQ26314.1 hypothetical protein MARPO_2879s0001 [Marchantia polymorpha]
MWEFPHLRISAIPQLRVCLRGCMVPGTQRGRGLGSSIHERWDFASKSPPPPAGPLQEQGRAVPAPSPSKRHVIQGTGLIISEN